jgi:hypothetical protein
LPPKTPDREAFVDSPCHPAVAVVVASKVAK